MPVRVLAPSDVSRSSSGRVHVGGGVLAGGLSRLVIADALARLVATGDGLAASPGDLVVLGGRLVRGVLTEARVLERTALPLPRGDGDVNRFCFAGTAERLRQRALAVAEIRAFFAEESFLEVETPIRVRAPGVDSHVEAVQSSGGYLITSPELAHKRLLVGGLPRLFELARVLRADEQGHLHEAEFTLLEWYRAFSGYEAVLADTERLVMRVARRLRKRAELVTPDGRKLNARAPFPRVSVRDAFRRWAGVRDAADLAASDESRFFELLVGRVEPRLAALDRPVFLVDYRPSPSASSSTPAASSSRTATASSPIQSSRPVASAPNVPLVSAPAARSTQRITAFSRPCARACPRLAATPSAWIASSCLRPARRASPK